MSVRVVRGSGRGCQQDSAGLGYHSAQPILRVGDDLLAPTVDGLNGTKPIDRHAGTIRPRHSPKPIVAAPVRRQCARNTTSSPSSR